MATFGPQSLLTSFSVSAPVGTLFEFQVNGVRYVIEGEQQASEAFAMLSDAFNDKDVPLSVVDQRMRELGAMQEG